MPGSELVSKHREYVLSAVANYYEEPLVLERGDGVRLFDVDGVEYLDFYGGILTVSVGHCNPDVTGSICEQVKRLQHTSTLYITPPMVELAEKLARITPGNLKRCFFTNSGTEANEMAVLLARAHTGRQEIVALRHAYSGRSLLAMSLTGQAAWRVGGAQIAGIVHAHNPYCYRCAFGRSYPGCELECARDLDELIRTSTSGGIAAFIAEPIQGVGGFVTPPPEYFKVALEIVKKYGGLFICDEVQTGFGRTGGRMFGIEHWSVTPDIMTMAKGIANGVPIGATITTDEVDRSFSGQTISTFGGNPVSTAAALATINYIEGRGLVENAAVLGSRLRSLLEELKARYRCIGDVRGMGLMQALEVVREGKEPAPDIVLRVFEESRKRGLLIGRGGLYNNVIRISPPLTVSGRDVEDACRVLHESFAAACKGTIA